MGAVKAMMNWRMFELESAENIERDSERAKSAPTRVIEPQDHGEVAPLEGKSILVVEDDFLIGFEIGRDLEDFGATVIGPASSVADAKTAIRNRRCDGAILDVNLGRETSLDLGRDLLAAGLPVLFVTAYVDYTALFDRGLELVPRLGKPISRELLRRKAAEAFARRRFDA